MHPDPYSIAALDILPRLAGDDAPVMLDLRIAEDIAEHPIRLPAARRVPYRDLDTQIQLSAQRGAICICHKGRKISHGVAARLRAAGIDAVVLDGGVVGWRDLGLPVLEDAAEDLLVLPHDASPTEIFQAWAHHRFCAPWADVLRVPRGDVPGVIDRFDAAAPAALVSLATEPAMARMATMAEGDVIAAICAGATDTAHAFACCDAMFRGLHA